MYHIFTLTSQYCIKLTFREVASLGSNPQPDVTPWRSDVLGKRQWMHANCFWLGFFAKWWTNLITSPFTLLKLLRYHHRRYISHTPCAHKTQFVPMLWLVSVYEIVQLIPVFWLIHVHGKQFVPIFCLICTHTLSVLSVPRASTIDQPFSLKHEVQSPSLSW